MKKLIAILIAVIYIIPVNAQSVNVEWVKQISADADERGKSVAVDAAGNVYTTGSFTGTVDFDPGNGTANLNAAGNRDIFVLKLDASGNFIWAKSMGGAANEKGVSIAVDIAGNIYTTGYFEGKADFDPGAGTAILTPTGFHDIFISKLNSSGDFVWAKNIGPAGTFVIQSTSITADALGNVYTAGYFQGGVDFDPGPATFNLFAGTHNIMFTLKLNAAGNFIRVKALEEPYSMIYAITTDTLNNLYATGWFSSSPAPLDFDPGPGTYYLRSDSGATFISKSDSGGNLIWAKNIGKLSEPNSIATDLWGNVYTTGWFREGDFDPGPAKFNLITAGSQDIFVSKLNASGNFAWAKSMGGVAEDAGKALAVDAAGNVYLTGWFEGIADFDPNAGVVNLTAPGTDTSSHYYPKSNFTQVLNANGNFLWAKNINEVSGKCITVDKLNNIYTIGSGLSIQKARITTSRIKENFGQITSAVYPNPTTGQFTLVVSNPINSTVKIYNSLGALVYCQAITKEEHAITLTGQDTGLYIVVVTNNGEVVATQKILKQ